MQWITVLCSFLQCSTVQCSTVQCSVEHVNALQLNIVCAIHFITVAKSKMYWQGVKSIAFGVKGQS